MLAEFIHMGILEIYHGLMGKKYCKKLQHYSYEGTWAYTQLAILEHNHVGQTQAQTKEGAKKHKFVSPEEVRDGLQSLNMRRSLTSFWRIF